ncbi:peptidase M28 [Paenibacillus vortex V453]|uniref:Peptidase M28 n=2 Tax=Paenibacillus TaxID=44249 RepID=A0A2R9T187_9BACL|nr:MULTISPECIES: M28 family peptidase [Paenibacillus]EFU43382.1 peptidase M28 [Paenibacillus vortex V453]MDH6671200.1 putative membrane protein YiaA [Paenibacillus sp. LBL]
MQIQLSRPPDRKPPYWLPLTTILAVILVISLMLWFEKPPQARSTDTPATEFSAERAMVHVEQIAQQPHPLGSSAHAEVRAYLVEQMEQLGLNPDVQEFNGRLTTKYIDQSVQLTNILGVIKGTGSGKPLLLMSHYDSVPAGPGANDASVSVASLLETARATQAGPPPQNDIWILLTDGEEKGLLGAEVFFRDPQHREIGMIANFEARGSKGSSFMFQTSDGNGRIIEEYARAVSNPVSNSLLVALYKQLPNDTDLTVALEHGLPGLNFAYGDGWVAYHTPMDNTDNVSLETMQHQGENALAMAKHFGNLDLSDLSSEGDRVYFNLFGLLLHYPAKWVVAITLVLAAIWLGLVFMFARISSLSIKGSLIGLLIPILAAVLSTALSYGLWKLIDALWAGKMTQPSGATYDSLLYSVSFILVTLIVHVALTRWILRKANELEMLLGGAFLFLLLLVGSSWLLPGASYLFAIPLLVHFIALAWAAFTRDPLQSLHHPAVVLTTTLVPILLFASIFHIVFLLLPPGIHLFSVVLVGFILALMSPAVRMLAQAWKWAVPAAFIAIIVLLGIGWTQAEPGPDRPVYERR